MSRLKAIEGYDLYYVSEDGNVYSDKYKVRRLLSTRKNSRGYLYVNLCRKGKYKSVCIHRIVANAFLEPVEDKFEVNHIDGNKENNNVNNLEWVSRNENMQHAIQLGLRQSLKHGLNPFAKLSEKDVLKIRDMYANGERIASIHRRFNMVSRQTISNICHNKRWI